MKILFLLFAICGLKGDISDDVDEPIQKIKEHVDSVKDNVEEQELKLSSELRGTLIKIEDTVGLTLQGIDTHTIQTSWRQATTVERDVDFETDVQYYKIKETQDVPCRTIDFLFNIKSDYDVYSYNCKKYL